MTGVICGTGASVPSHILTNHDIAKLVDTSDEWIKERTGIEKRHIIQSETTVSLAAEAGRQALDDAGVKPEEVDLILVATISSNVILPCTACEVQRILRADHAVCFDLNAACSGFIFAYQTAFCYLESGMYNTALIIGSESLSNLTNWKDRGTCILFGDGAGAAVVKRGEGTAYRAVMHSDGSLSMALTCESSHPTKSNIFSDRGQSMDNEKETPQMQQKDSDAQYMQMDGRGVFSFAVRKVPEAIAEVLALNNLQPEDIDYFLLHQANRRIVESVSKRMGIGIEKFPMNLQEYGNTSSASIPILMNELRKNGTLKPGQRIVLAGFGAGLSWGAGILDWKI